MQVQCPKCKEWTDSESGICQMCGYRISKSTQEYIPKAIKKEDAVGHVITDPPPKSRIVLSPNTENDFRKIIYFVLGFIFLCAGITLPITCHISKQVKTRAWEQMQEREIQNKKSQEHNRKIRNPSQDTQRQNDQGGTNN